MNGDKRYCQNRQRKRKRTIALSPIEKNVSSAEGERQFKLRRFVEDIGKFLSEKEECSDQKIIPKTKTSLKAQRTTKKVTLPKTGMKRGQYQQGMMQTKFFTRGGVVPRGMTAKLDENMHQIISQVNNSQCKNQCLCTLHCKRSIEQKTSLGLHKWGIEPHRQSVLEPLQQRSSPNDEDLCPSPNLHSNIEREEQLATTSSDYKCGKSPSELDRELYPLFARVVSMNCMQTKSALFKNQSYVNAVKGTLLEIYANGVEKKKGVLTSSSEPQKTTRSVGTSPFPSPTNLKRSHKKEPVFKLSPAKLRFPSSIKFLEETVDPSSTCSSKQMIPSPKSHQPTMQGCQSRFHYHQTPQWLLSPPVVGHQRPQVVPSYVPKVNRYVHEPFVRSYPSISPFYNFRSKVFHGGGGDGFHFNCCNSFLPPIEEEVSPDFRYYPRKKF